jgi:alpha-beta hydrolase superfamily lysophospholipase
MAEICGGQARKSITTSPGAPCQLSLRPYRFMSMRWLKRLLKLFVTLVLLFLVGGPIAVALSLYIQLTPGYIDWAGPSETDPMVVGYRGDPKAGLGLDFTEVSYETPLGLAPAWVIPAPDMTRPWAIFVHGIGGLRSNGYRMVQYLHAAGIPVLSITYRNDAGAPKSPEQLYSFGLVEWPDLAAAVTYARAQGAPKVLIVAESMGGAITAQFLAQSAEAVHVAAIALDAPALDLPLLLKIKGEDLGIPLSGYLVDGALMAWALVKPDLRGAVVYQPVVDFKGPVFLAHSRPDPLVPYETSANLMAMRPDIRFLATDSPKHLGSYSADPAAFGAAFNAWIADAEAAAK